MKKVAVICILVMILTGCSEEEKSEKGYSYMTVTTSGREIILAYRDEGDAIDEQKAVEVQTNEVISQFLNRNRKDLEFERFCMLEENSMTIEVMVAGMFYTFTYSVEDDIVGMWRIDEEILGIR